MQSQNTHLHLKNWIGSNAAQLVQLKHWPKIRKEIVAATGIVPTAREVFDLLFPKSVKHCDNIRFEKFSVGYVFCKKNCQCYTAHLSKQVSCSKLAVDDASKVATNSKRKDTVQQKYGVSNVSQHQTVKDTIAQSKTDRYGSATYNNPEKIKETNIERYGVSNVMQVSEIAAKALLDRDHELSYVRAQSTKLKKYGDENYRNNDQIVKTNLSRYGTANPAQSKVVQDKITNSLAKTFVPRHSERYNVTPAFGPYQLYAPGEKNLWTCNTCNTTYNGRVLNGKFSRCLTCYPHGSMGENQVKDFVRSFGFTIVENDRSIIPPKEIDIWIPELNLAIEYCGLYWHRESAGKSKSYHQDKLRKCHDLGIKLITIFSDQWENNEQVVKSRLQQLLGKTAEKIYARQCTLKSITYAQSKQFLEQYHLQGSCVSKEKLGLFYKDQLVAVMTFGKSRFSSSETEIIRFACKTNTHIPGAASKLLASYLQTSTNEKVVTYSDNAWGLTDFYSKIGFVKTSDGVPGYHYIDLTGKDPNRLNRMRFQKHKILTMFTNSRCDQTEYEIMQNNGYDRIWDCGQSRWELLVKNDETRKFK